MKCFVYNALISWWTIFHSKRHHHLDKCFPISNKNNLVSIFRCNGYLKIFRKYIYKWISLVANNIIEDLIYKWKRIWIFFRAFNFWKFTQIHSWPLFLGTTTIGDNQQTSSMCWINHITKSLSMFCLTTST